MKYPPFSWLRLGEEIKHSPGKIWFSFDKLPKDQQSATAQVFIGNQEKSYNNPYDAISNNDILLPRQQKVLELFLSLSKASKNKNEFIVDYAAFSRLLPFSSAVSFEVTGLGVLNFSKNNARLKADLNEDDKGLKIVFALTKNGIKTMDSLQFFGDINAYVIDSLAMVYPVTPAMTTNEIKAILSTSGLLLVGLCQKESRDMFYSLARLGVDFSCLNKIAITPKSCKIYLRIILEIDPKDKKMCIRAHLVTELIDENFKDEVEIRAIGSIPSIHICADKNLDEEKFNERIEIPKLLRRPYKEEQEARNFLYHLGASPAKNHEGFYFNESNSFLLLKAISQKDGLPSFINLDENTRPKLIYLPNKPRLIIVAKEKKPTRVETAIGLNAEYDETNTPFKKLLESKDNLLVIDEEILAISNEDLQTTLKYLSKTLSIDEPNIYKSKSVAQIALIINALKDHLEIVANPELLDFLTHFKIVETKEDRILPKSLKAVLRPYQHDAVAWLSSLYRSGLGGLLGDEMGLGKTLMVLTHLAKLKEQGLSKNPNLVVCPTSVIDVWVSECQKHLPSLKITKWHGALRLEEKENLTKNDIIVTSYAILRRDIDSVLGQIHFSTLVLDEAQFIRNEQTDSFKAAKKIKCEHRIALTGTPIENHVTDLFNILDCVEEGILGNKRTFEQQFSAPIEQGSSWQALNLKMLIAPVVTRRRKSEVESELPPKIENVVYCKLTAEQRNLYNKYVNDISHSFIKETHFSLLSSLTRLRQICCHPSLLGHDFHQSGKIICLREILKECLEMGRKIIIYSQFIKMQEHIVNLAKELDEKGALWLHGSTKDRESVVSEFQKEDGPRVIVVSLKAGGTGITLTAADTVIFADPWWNPAVEDQAIDRAHRIGQKKTVHVIRLIAEDSIEEEVVALAQRKKIAAHNVLQEGFKVTTNLTKEEVYSLLSRELDRVKYKDNKKDLYDDEE